MLQYCSDVLCRRRKFASEELRICLLFLFLFSAIPHGSSSINCQPGLSSRNSIFSFCPYCIYLIKNIFEFFIFYLALSGDFYISLLPVIGFLLILNTGKILELG